MLKGVVTIKAWKRDYFLKECLESITGAIGFKDYKYIISIDNHPATKDASIAAVKEFKKSGVDIDLYYQGNNLGCAGNMRFCFEKAFDGTDYDYMIHLEEDIIISKDVFLWIEWVMERTKDDDNFLAASPFTRKAQQAWYPEYNFKIDENFIHDRFECGGGWAMHRNMWNFINDNGGLFGAAGNTNVEIADPEKWKYRSDLILSDKASWAWVVNHYFRRGRYSISPMVSRTNNFGDKEGLYNPSPEWHNENVWDPKWCDHPGYDTINFNNIQYKEPVDNRDNHNVE